MATLPSAETSIKPTLLPSEHLSGHKLRKFAWIYGK